MAKATKVFQNDPGLKAVHDALDVKGFSINSSTEFDHVFDHVVSLLEDAVACFMRSSHGTASFLAITAIEEAAKCEVGSYRQSSKGEIHPRHGDPLFNHKQKHRMAVLPTVFMGSRLINAIGAERCAYLQEAAIAGKLIELREAALYAQRPTSALTTPSDAIAPRDAREVLLLAIEVTDDRLVGYTHHSMNRSDHLNTLFQQVADFQAV